MATPTVACGFECGVSASTAHWTLGANTAFSTSTVRSGSRSLRANPTASTAIATGVTQYTSTTRHIGRIYVQFATLPSASNAIAAFGFAGYAGPNVRFNASDSKLYAAVGTTLGASGVSVTTGQWYRIDWDFNVNTGGNDACDVQVDGTACGQATAAGESSSVATDDIGILTAAATADVFFDDFLGSSTAADYPLGAGYVNHFVPTADGTHNIAGTGDFQRTLTGTDILNATTTAFQLVDEVPLESTSTDWINMVAPPNATDYVECIFGNAPGISTPTTGPRAVEVICGINQAGTGAGNMEIRLNDNGTTNAVYSATGVAGIAVASGQIFKRKHYATAPTGGAWVIGGGGDGDFTDLRIRFGSPAAVDANPDQYFGCAMIEAEFVEVPATPFPFVWPMRFVRKKPTRSQKQRLI